jgi:hypothetical protein
MVNVFYYYATQLTTQGARFAQVQGSAEGAHLNSSFLASPLILLVEHLECDRISARRLGTEFNFQDLEGKVSKLYFYTRPLSLRNAYGPSPSQTPNPLRG